MGELDKFQRQYSRDNSINAARRRGSSKDSMAYPITISHQSPKNRSVIDTLPMARPIVRTDVNPRHDDISRKKFLVSAIAAGVVGVGWIFSLKQQIEDRPAPSTSYSK